jgi:pimeloyl-ACP methyl ester carboxylesterase
VGALERGPASVLAGSGFDLFCMRLCARDKRFPRRVETWLSAHEYLGIGGLPVALRVMSRRTPWNAGPQAQPGWLQGGEMKKLIGSLLGTALLAIGLAASANASPVPVLNWNPCSPDGAVCAAAQVPLDYDDPAGAKTFVVLARYPVNPATKIGTVFVNFGGPGVSGITRLIQSGFGLTLRALLQGRFDVVAFDPRGVGYSDPLQCFDTEGDRMAFGAAHPIFPYFDEQERPYFDAYGSLGPLCLGRGQPIALHMSTGDVARDLDLLRQAVGDDRITYLGFSYGSYLGNTYANMFPDKVRALVIDGVLNPLIWTIGRQISSDRLAVAAVAEEFNRLLPDEWSAGCSGDLPCGRRVAEADAGPAAQRRPLHL